MVCMNWFILIGLPIVALAAYLISKFEASQYDKDLLSLIFSLRLSDEKDPAVTELDFSPVNTLTEQDLSDSSVYMQTKL